MGRARLVIASFVVAGCHDHRPPAAVANQDERLRTKYRVVERMLISNENQSLELAVDRLMKHPQLAWQLVEANEPSPSAAL